LLPELQAELDLLPAGQMTFLVSERGGAFRPASFTGWFHKMCTQAGLPDGRSVHGLRKSGATRLAEHGATDHEIMAWGGWATLAEVTRYTRAANRRKLAQGVVLKLETRTPSGNPK
jgi:integrase